ncbi:glutamine amidotransferase [Marinobacterium nitratireducens]|uniref:Glutamine amidotransferase n=1 Tax=Marinobacterium nitratireducens TaxID=518897 RepID=A0A917ZM44_9GAMM|nr:glutamine amidotransferase [Marinobacterium nitratireducens]GGO84629.1 glutamine amidotransferase [Marinobacterium nitratireducens]
MKIGILAAGISPEELRSRHGSYAEMFIALLGASEPSFGFRTYEVRNDDFPDAATDCDGWIITGSACGVYDNLPWMVRLKQLVLAIYQSGRPLVGICFGHQIVASAFGARVEKFDGGWGVGRQYYRIEGRHAFVEPDTRGFTINAMHQDQVLEQPAGAKIFATSDFCRFAGLVYDDRIFTLQAHPEFSLEFEAALLKLRSGAVIPQAVAEGALATLAPDASLDSALVARWMVRFLTGLEGPLDGAEAAGPKTER